MRYFSSTILLVRDVSSDFVGRFVASKTVWERFLCTDFSSEVFVVRIFLQGLFGRDSLSGSFW